jgi:hypothetical protein
MPIHLRPKKFLGRETTLEDAEKLIQLEQRIKQKDLELERLTLENEQLREKIKQSAAAAELQRQIEGGKFEIERERFRFLRGLLNRLVWIFTAALVFTGVSLLLASLGIITLENSQKDILAGAILTEIGGLAVAALAAFAGTRAPKDGGGA